MRAILKTGNNIIFTTGFLVALNPAMAQRKASQFVFVVRSYLPPPS